MDILYIRNKFIFFQKVRVFDSIIHEYLQTLPKIFTCVILFASFFVVLGAKNTIMDEMTEDLIQGNQFVKKLPDKTPPDYTVDKNSKCSLHSLEMNRTEVDISYGKPNESKEREMKIVGTNFPNGRNYILGGCVVWSGMDIKANIYLCPSCVEVRNKWLEKNSMDQIWVDRVKQMLR